MLGQDVDGLGLPIGRDEPFELVPELIHRAQFGCLLGQPQEPNAQLGGNREGLWGGMGARAIGQQPDLAGAAVAPYPSGQGGGCWVRAYWPCSPFLIEAKLLEAFDAAFGKTERIAVFGPVDPEKAVLRVELLGELVQPLLILTEHLGDAGDGEHAARRGDGQAASAAVTVSWALRQFQGSSSCSREAGWLAMRASTSASQARGSTPFSLAVMMSEYMAAARSPPRSLPANSHDRRPRAMPRSARSAALFVRQIRPSSRNRLNASQRVSM